MNHHPGIRVILSFWAGLIYICDNNGWEKKKKEKSVCRRLLDTHKIPDFTGHSKHPKTNMHRSAEMQCTQKASSCYNNTFDNFTEI